MAMRGSTPWEAGDGRVRAPRCRPVRTPGTSCRTCICARLRRSAGNCTTSNSRPSIPSRTRSRLPPRSSRLTPSPPDFAGGPGRRAREPARATLWGQPSFHVDYSVRWNRLRHAAVRAGLWACRHARPDELRQSRPRLVRHGGRLHHAHPGQPQRHSIFRRPADRLRGDRRHWGAVRAHPLRSRLCQAASRPGAVTIGLVFMSVAAVDYVMGSQQQYIQLPSMLQGQINLLGLNVGKYRLLIIVICGLLTIALQFILAGTRFGSRLRASVDDPRVASGLGIHVKGVFAVTFAVGSGLAGLGGALGAEILGLDPTFPLKFMIYFLIVVTVGGTSSITGPFLASLLLGIGDVAGKYYVPKFGAFVIYTIMIVVLIWRPQGLFARSTAR